MVLLSHQFLTPSIIEGLRQKLFPNDPGQKILRHRLRYKGMSVQQECIQAKTFTTEKKVTYRKTGIINRGILIEPTLFLVFSSITGAYTASTQHICLCRNEDVFLPNKDFGIRKINEEEFENPSEYYGFELLFEKSDASIYVGHNRFTNESMFGKIHIIGDPSQ